MRHRWEAIRIIWRTWREAGKRRWHILRWLMSKEGRGVTRYLAFYQRWSRSHPQPMLRWPLTKRPECTKLDTLRPEATEAAWDQIEAHIRDGNFPMEPPDDDPEL